MGVYQQILFSGSFIKIGTFRACPDGDRFHNSGPTGGHLIVFPRVPVLITHAGGKPIAANPNLVMFYNQGQEYRRDVLAPQGDYSQWIGFDEAALREIIQAKGISAQNRPHRVFSITHGPVEAYCYALQRGLIQYLHGFPQPDPVLVEETALRILSSVVNSAYQAWFGPIPTRKRSTTGMDQEITRYIEQILALRFREKLTLEAIAAETQYSPFHISRVFRQQTGQTIHHYLTQLRLRTGYEQILSGEEDLTRLAVDLGFTSHSHFTQAFHQTFGQPPSHTRKTALLPAKI